MTSRPVHSPVHAFALKMSAFLLVCCLSVLGLEAASAVRASADTADDITTGSDTADTLMLATFFTPGATDSSPTTVHVYTSTDGREFDLPQGAQSIGGSGTSMNDPSVMYRDGYFWIVSGVKVAGQPALQIFYSADLRTWNSLPVTLLDASWDGGVDSVAPEWFQDAGGSLFVTLSIGNYFSGQGQPLGQQEDLRPFLTQVTLPDPSSGAAATAGPVTQLNLVNGNYDHIDGFIRQTAAGYQFIAKPRAVDPLEIWQSDSLTGGWTLENANPFGQRTDDDAYRQFEGPAVADLAGTTFLYADNYNNTSGTQTGVNYSTTTDGVTFTTPRPITDSQGNQLAVRHGTVVTLSDAHAKCVAWAYRNGTTCDDQQPGARLVTAVRTDGPVIAGRPVRYQVAVSNLGTADASGATATLSAGSLTVPGSLDIGDIAAGTTVTRSFSATPSSASGVATLGATVTGSGGDRSSGSLASPIRSGVPGQPHSVYMKQQTNGDLPPTCAPGVTDDSGGQNLVVCWADPSDDGGSPLTGYTVTVRGADGATWVHTVNARTLSSSFPGLPGGQLYSIHVTADTALAASASTGVDGLGPNSQIWVSPGQSADPQPFSDVPVGNQFYVEISWLAGKGISTGWQLSDGTRLYEPLQPVHRDAMAAFLYRLAGSPAYAPPSTSPFSDITPDTQFYKEMCWLQHQGISTGWQESDGTRSYRPLEPISRDAMAAFMYRYAGSPIYTAPAASPFTDVSAGMQFSTEMSWMKAWGISTGWPDGSYRPLDPVDRDAMAAFMDRLAG